MHGSLSHFIGRPFDVFVNGTGTAFNVHGFGVDFVNLIHPLGIQHNSAAYRDGTALGSATAAPGCYRDFIIVGDFQHLGGFLSILRGNYKIRFRHHAAAVGPHPGKPVVVHTVSQFIDWFGGTVFGSDRVFQLGQNHGS